MSVLWTDDLATGIDVIDGQHRELFRRANNLLQACLQGKGKEEVRGLLSFLEEYISTHLRDEEAYMVKHAYPQYNSHKELHAELIRNFSSLEKKFEAEGASVHMVMSANLMIVDWLRRHIRKADKEFAKFLKLPDITAF